MRESPCPVVLATLSLFASQPAFAEDGLCKPLRDFVTSVKPDETRVVKFHTKWGSNFNDSDEPVLFAKRCNHDGYAPAKILCEYLVAHSVTEFAGLNAKRVIECLSRKTRFASSAELGAISLSLVYGNDDGGGLVDITYSEDPELGGMLLSVTVEGY